jgi:hypothetical protein
MTYAEQRRIEHLPNLEQDSNPTVDRIIDLTSQSLFLESGYERGLDLSDPQSEDYARHLSEYAEDYCRVSKLDGTEDQVSLSEIALFANAPLLVLQQQKKYKNDKTKQYLASSEYRQMKDDLRIGNQLISNYIDHHMTENADTLVNNLTEMVNRFKDHPDGSVRTIIDDHVMGIRTETGFIQLANQLKGVKVRRASQEQDGLGIDAIVDVSIPTRPDAITFDLDIKKSLDQVAGLAGGYSDTQDTFAMIKKGHFKFCPLIPQHAYENGSFLVKTEFLDLMAPHMGMQLYKMAMSS